MTYDLFRKQVLDAVKEKLRKESWFRGVCLEGMDEYFPNDLAGAIENAHCETLYHDAPNRGF